LAGCRSIAADAPRRTFLETALVAPTIRLRIRYAPACVTGMWWNCESASCSG